MQLEPVRQAGERVVARHVGDAVGRLAGAGHVRADAVIAGEAALLVERGLRGKLDALDLVVDREADDQFAERLLARHRRLGSGERAPCRLVGARQCPQQVRQRQALELVHVAADRPREAGGDVLEAHWALVCHSQSASELSYSRSSRLTVCSRSSSAISRHFRCMKARPLFSTMTSRAQV